VPTVRAPDNCLSYSIILFLWSVRVWIYLSSCVIFCETPTFDSYCKEHDGMISGSEQIFKFKYYIKKISNKKCW
jgi:hypothetical protein